MEQRVADNDKKSIKEFTTTILRRIRKIDYKNVPLMPGFERSETEYVSLRNTLNASNLMIKDLMCYEHGNRFYKAIKDKIQFINDKTALGLYKNQDVYESLALITNRLSLMSVDPEDRAVSNSFSTAYKRISVAKKNLNAKLEEMRIKLKEKRMLAIEIDANRKRVKNMRYNLEVLLRDESYDSEIKEIEKKSFYNYSGHVLKEMVKFSEDSTLADVLKAVAKLHNGYLKEVSEILKPIE